MKTNKVFRVWHSCLVLFVSFLSASIQAEIAETITYKQIEWVELIPQDDLDALLNPPDFLSNIVDGSEQDSIAALSAKSVNKEAGRFQQALTSVQVIKSFDNKAIRIPGYLVPLVNDEQQNVTEFFIVPYFGACLHMPPPPPNQMIYGKLPKGFKLNELTEAFWFEGVIHIETTNTENGTSAYGMNIDNIQIFE